MARALVPTVCPYCAAGCGFFIAVQKGRASGIEYMPDHPASEGALCSKGNAALEILDHPDRLRTPLRRKGDGWERISWDEALDLVAKGLDRALKSYGPDSIGFLSSSKCSNEENYLFQKLARSIGCRNVDSCARLCHAPSVVGLNRTLGVAGMTNPIPDVARSKCIFIIGSNLAENHPVLSRWVHRARDAGTTVIVADTRRTHTFWMADIFLPLKPGTDVASSEPCSQNAQKALEALDIICRVAGRMGLDFSYPDVASVLAEINRLVPQYGGITRERLDPHGLVWPCSDSSHPGTPILHAGGFKLDGGRAAIVPVQYRPPEEPISSEYPFILTTGRVAVHHNAGSMTRRSPSLQKREPDLFFEINLKDAQELDVADGDEVTVASSRGETVAVARLTDGMKRGVVFMPFHFPRTNILTSEFTDDEAWIPEFKVSACKITKRD